MRTNPSGRPSRSAFTMIELLVSMAISLVVVYALVEFMKTIGDTVTDGRAMIDLATQLRGVRQRLDEDLKSLTVQTRPWSDNGYFEYREGPLWDADADGNGTLDFNRASPTVNYDIENNGGNTLFGDWDDILAFTAHSGAEPFVGQIDDGTFQGRNGGPTLTSQLSEIVWFCGFEDKDGDNVWDAGESRFIYRRTLLIRPDLGDGGSTYASAAEAYNALADFWQLNDLSVKVVNVGMGQWRLRANSLTDLSRRENRFAHQQAFPSRWNFDPRGTSQYVFRATATGPARLGEDVMMSRVLSFDVQVFDPDASILRLKSDPTGAALTPESPYYTPDRAKVDYGNGSGTYLEIGKGAFVDLGYAASSPIAASPPQNRYRETVTNFSANGLLAYGPDGKSGFGNQEWIWDTWSNSYEMDTVDQFSDSRTDTAHDGLDNDNQNGVDDVGERETSPPYPVPIRGLKVTMRIYDPNTRQVRQGTVTAEFLPE